MKKLLSLIMGITLSMGAASAQNGSIYDFTVQDAKGKDVKLSEYKGKVLLIVNTASRCGFTPQYEELESMYKQLSSQGFEILDFPCNQFGQQAPESDAEYVEFCRLKYNTEFRQFHKIEVNGPGEIPLYTYLKKQQNFEGFDKNHNLTPILERMFDNSQPGWRDTSDIKWNFTKFLVDQNGNVVARFEPTTTPSQIIPVITELLKK